MPADVSSAVRSINARPYIPILTKRDPNNPVYTARTVIQDSSKGSDVTLFEWDETLPGPVADVSALRSVGIDILQTTPHHYTAIVDIAKSTNEGTVPDGDTRARVTYVVDHGVDGMYWGKWQVVLDVQPNIFSNAVSEMVKADIGNNQWELVMTPQFMQEVSLFA